jgi:hypothetical protein
MGRVKTEDRSDLARGHRIEDSMADGDIKYGVVGERLL